MWSSTARPRPRATTIRALARRHRSRTIVIATQAAAVSAGGHCSVNVVGGAVSIPQAIFANSSPTASWTPRITSRGNTAPESVQPARGAQDHEDHAHEQRPGGDHVGTGTGGDRRGAERLQRLDGDRHAVAPGDDQVQQAGGQQDRGGRQPVAHDQGDRDRDQDAEVGDRAGGLPPPRRGRGCGGAAVEGGHVSRPRTGAGRRRWCPRGSARWRSWSRRTPSASRELDARTSANRGGSPAARAATTSVGGPRRDVDLRGPGGGAGGGEHPEGRRPCGDRCVWAGRGSSLSPRSPTSAGRAG